MKFIVPGKPQAKQRPRFSRRGKYITTYTPKDTQDYEKLVKLSALEQCKGQLDKEYVGSVKMSIKAYFKPNKSISKKQYNLLIGQAHLKKPDSDNIAKIICDALNKVAYKDDSQIYELYIKKYYDEQERIEVEVDYRK